MTSIADWFLLVLMGFALLGLFGAGFGFGCVVSSMLVLRELRGLWPDEPDDPEREDLPAKPEPEPLPAIAKGTAKLKVVA